jgi:hypothetical protein
MNGVHYWEIIADRRTENELKIGITKNINFNYDTVKILFCYSSLFLIIISGGLFME